MRCVMGLLGQSEELNQNKLLEAKTVSRFLLYPSSQHTGPGAEYVSISDYWRNMTTIFKYLKVLQGEGTDLSCKEH